MGRIDSKTLVIHPEGAVPSALDLPQGVSLCHRPDGALALTYRRGQITTGAVLDAARDAGVQIRDVATEEADLEDVFVALTSSR